MTMCYAYMYFHCVKLKLKSYLILNHLVQFSYFVVVSLFAAFPGIYARSIFSNKKGGGRRMFKHTQYNHLDLQIKKSPKSTGPKQKTIENFNPQIKPVHKKNHLNQQQKAPLINRYETKNNGEILI